MVFHSHIFQYSLPKFFLLALVPLLIDWESQQVVQAIVESMELAQVSLEEFNSQQKTKSQQNRNNSEWIERFGRLDLVEPGGRAGDCQFRSLSWILFGDPHHYIQLRQQIAREIRNHKNDFEAARSDVPFRQPFDTVEEYCKELETSQLWGNHATLQACSNIYDLNIQVLSSLNGGSKIHLIQPRQNANCERTIFLAHQFEMHYQGIKPKSIESKHRGTKRRESATRKTKPNKRAKKSTRYIVFIPFECLFLFFASSNLN